MSDEVRENGKSGGALSVLTESMFLVSVITLAVIGARVAVDTFYEKTITFDHVNATVSVAESRYWGIKTSVQNFVYDKHESEWMIDLGNGKTKRLNDKATSTIELD